MAAQRALIMVATALAICASSCQSLMGAMSEEPTPVPGAAATLTRSNRTPIPTPVRTPSPAAAASPAPARSPAVASPSASPVARAVSEEEIGELRREIERALSAPGLPGIEALLLDRVSLSTTEGGDVMDRDQAAQWLRDRAGPGVKVTRVDRSALAVLLEVLTEGWPIAAPINEGRVTFNLHRYDESGRQDEDHGAWKVDVIGAE
jgi:hypothetical protein